MALMKPEMSSRCPTHYSALMGVFPGKQWSGQARKAPRLLLLALLLLQVAGSGCHAPTQTTEFSGIPDYMLGQPRPRAVIAALDIVGARPGVEKTSLVKGIREAMGPASDSYPEPEKMSDAKKLADRVLAGDKVTLHLPPDMAKGMARNLEAAGLIVKLSE